MKKKMKRTFGLLMSLVMLASVLSVPMVVNAAGPEPQFTLNNATGSVGDIVEVIIDVTGNPYLIGSADLSLFFDTTMLEFVPPNAPAPDTYKFVENSYVSTGSLPQVGTTVAGRLKIAYSNAYGITDEGTFMHFKFRILPGLTATALLDLVILEVTDAESGDVYDATAVDGSVSLLAATPVYEITFNAAGGAGGGTLLVDEGVVPTAPVVTRDGYNFVEWTPAIVAATENTTYTAVWAEILMSTITFDSKLGSVVDPITGEVGTPVTPPANPTREGYTFMGWDPALPVNFPSGGLATSAMWQAIEYQITFDAAGGIGSQVQIVGYDATPTPPIVTRDGYTFVEWTPAVTFVTGPATYTAVWEEIPAVTYQITFDAAGGVGGDVQTVAEGDFPVTPADPTRDGYTFMGWDPEVIVAATENATYTAVWELIPVLYTIIFDDNDGFGGEIQSVLEGVVPTAPIVTKDGFNFLRWDPEVIVAATENATYTAVWEEIVIATTTITFNTDGGSLIDPITGEIGSAVTAPADPTKDGFVFIGWSPEIPAVFPEQNLEVTAQWVEDLPTTYEITFDAAGGIGDDWQTVEEGVVPVPPVVTRDGYTFVEWTPAIVAATANATYTAVWEEIIVTPTTYQITFDAAGGTGGVVLTVEEGVMPIAPIVSRDGYTLIGWDAAIVAAVADATYTAVWEEIIVTPTTYEITFDAAGGIGGEVQTVEEGAMPMAPVVSREGYNFLGWSPEIIAAAADATYTALWEEIVIATTTISFNTDGGNLIASITGEIGSAVTAPADPTKDGFVFIGWSPVIPAVFPEQNLEVTAQWEEKAETLLGDIDGDGEINVLDALMALQSNTGAITLTPEQFEAADVNRDGRVSALDALMILHFVSGRLPSFPSPVAE